MNTLFPPYWVYVNKNSQTDISVQYCILSYIFLKNNIFIIPEEQVAKISSEEIQNNVLVEAFVIS